MKKSQRSFFTVLMCAVLFAALILSASADTGPKPTAWIKLENAPDIYYMDILATYPDRPSMIADDLYRNLYEEELAELDGTMINALKNCGTDGWFPCLTVGTVLPMFGSVVPDENNENHFGYFGLPSSFRVAVATPDGKVRLSDTITMTLYQEHITVDYTTMTVTSGTPSAAKSYALQFLTTFIPTLAIELLLLLLFKICFKKNWYKVLVVNAVTQAALTVFLADIFLTGGFSVMEYLPFIFAEVCITLVETAAYLVWIKDEKTCKKVVYALSANIASAIAGGLLLNFAYNSFWIG